MVGKAILRLMAGKRLRKGFGRCVCKKSWLSDETKSVLILTKIHLMVDSYGLLVEFEITGGEVMTVLQHSI